jgi:16S rRNA (guanine(966)-N(2))-methyltransferase RsmD
MRVIAGTSRGRRLTMFEGDNVRPTPDRVREALFSILQSKLGSFSDIKVLDLFAGSGALATEALSRGAAFAFLVEKDRSAESVIRKNLALCQFEEKTTLLVKDALRCLHEFPSDTFNLIFLDPPYAKGLAELALLEIEKQGILADNGIICAETGANESLPEKVGSLQRIDQRRYGSIMINFYAQDKE